MIIVFDGDPPLLEDKMREWSIKSFQETEDFMRKNFKFYEKKEDIPTETDWIKIIRREMICTFGSEHDYDEHSIGASICSMLGHMEPITYTTLIKNLNEKYVETPEDNCEESCEERKSSCTPN